MKMDSYDSYDSPSKKSSFTSRRQVGASPVLWRRFYLDRAKLKATSRTSALLSGFAMVAMVELQLSAEPDSGERISYIIFAIITTLLIATHMFSLLISTCILPSLEVVPSGGPGSAGMHADLRGTTPTSTPYKSMRVFIEVAWICSTGFGIILFFVEVGILSWVKFYKAVDVAAYASIALVIPIFFLFTIFAFKFYKQMVEEKFEEEDDGLVKLYRLHSQIEEDERLDERVETGVRTPTDYCASYGSSTDDANTPLQSTEIKQHSNEKAVKVVDGSVTVMETSIQMDSGWEGSERNSLK